MIFITDKEIEALQITPAKSVEWVREAFLLKEKVELPAKISLHPQGTDFITTMPCMLPAPYHRFGCKVVSRIKDSEPSLKSELLLLDTRTGETLALLESNLITSLRTAAVATLAIETLKQPGARIFSFIGLGVIGRATLECFLSTSAFQDMTVRLFKYKDHAERELSRLSAVYPEVRFEVADGMEALVKDADVVVSCITDAREMLVKDPSLFKPGVLVVPVHTRGFQNCDTVFDRVVADDEAHVAGFRYYSEFRELCELAEILKDPAKGRRNGQERILSYNIGLGLHDVWFADKIYKLLRK